MTKKIFCIGFHKTGTKSLAKALKLLGYQVTGPNGVKDPDIAKNVYTMADALVKEYDAFQDNPWPVIYPYIDKKYPNSRFILTTRSTETWINSQVSYFGSRETPMRQWVYGVGSPLGNEKTYINRFEKHNQGVLEYFKDRPNDLLVLDLTRGDGWNELGNFLGLNVPDIPFPHSNKTRVPKNLNSLRTSFAKLTQKLSF